MTFYEWLTGRLPFEARDAVEWVYCHVARQPPALSEFRGDIPQPLSQLVLKLIAKNPDDRYQSAGSLLADLRSCKCQWHQFKDIPDLGLDPSADRGVAWRQERTAQARRQDALLASRTSVVIPGGQDTWTWPRS